MSNLSRRLFLTTAPAAAVVAGIPALTVDPIFAAIERHRAAEAICLDTVNPADIIWCNQNGVPLTPEAVAANDAANKAEYAALTALIATVPTTLAGVRAAVTYFVEFDEANVPETSGKFMRTLLRSPALA